LREHLDEVDDRHPGGRRSDGRRSDSQHANDQKVDDSPGFDSPANASTIGVPAPGVTTPGGAPPGISTPGVPAVEKVAESKDPFRVLVSTVISLRTKDQVTARASVNLLSRADSPGRMRELSEGEIGRLIYPAGFYRVKAKHLKMISAMLMDRHGGEVPREMADLLALPGVGRKTANLVRNLGFGLPGICVDTHVHRITNRLGWISTKSPEKTEHALEAILPKRYWIPINGLLVRFGQRVCTPVSPRCSLCFLVDYCPRVGVQRSR
jgi:endonuclease-3